MFFGFPLYRIEAPELAPALRFSETFILSVAPEEARAAPFFEIKSCALQDAALERLKVVFFALQTTVEEEPLLPSNAKSCVFTFILIDEPEVISTLVLFLIFKSAFRLAPEEISA